MSEPREHEGGFMHALYLRVLEVDLEKDLGITAVVCKHARHYLESLHRTLSLRWKRFAIYRMKSITHGCAVQHSTIQFLCQNECCRIWDDVIGC
jgi:hypothetical protein